MAQKRPITPEENKTANILSGISLGCMILPMILSAVQSGLTGMYYSAGMDVPIWISAISALGSGGFIAAIVLIIIVRVKYPGNVFGKVLMWIYIVFGIIAAVVFCIVMIACAIACDSCLDSCKGLGFIGVMRWR